MSREPETIDAVELPPDPDEMNEDRAMWAGSCIQRMADLTGCEPGQEALGDLLCDLFHWCDRNGISNEELIAIFHCRYRMYQQETMPLPEED